MSARPTVRRILNRMRAAYGHLMDIPILRFAPEVSTVVCPVCDRSKTKSISFGCDRRINGPSATLPEVRSHVKYVCMGCGHYFTAWLDTDLEQIGEKFEGIYESDQLFRENSRAAYQLNLLSYALKRLEGKSAPRILDFGCGPNTSPTMTMREDGHDVRCCDILGSYPYDGDIFFRYDGEDTRWERQFDAIVSIDVIEHLGNTRSSWRELNRLLAPDGIMAHCFPTRLHYGLRHPCCRTPFHTCIFSRESLQLIAEKSGFRLEAIKPFDADVPYVFYFRKIGEAQ